MPIYAVNMYNHVHMRCLQLYCTALHFTAHVQWKTLHGLMRTVRGCNVAETPHGITNYHIEKNERFRFFIFYKNRNSDQCKLFDS